MTDAQIQDEIAAQIAAGRLPTPDENTLYFVFTPPHVLVVDPPGKEDSVYSYHSTYGWGQVVYAVIPYWDDHYPWQPGDAPLMMTAAASHELAEAVTNSDLCDGWYDERNGEIADIAWSLYQNKQIDAYNKIVAQVNNGNYRDASKALTEFLTTASDPDIVRDAKKLQKQLAEYRP